MSEVYETKNDSLILVCDCGLIHTIKQNEDGELIVNTKYKKPVENKNNVNKEDKVNETKKDRKGFFSK
jgi:hypothetical protein